MFGLPMTAIVMAASALAALALVVVLLGHRKPKRAEKWEKAAIMKQLLAASEREESMLQMKQAMKARTATPQPGMRPVAAAAKAALRSTTPAAKPAVKVNTAAAGKAR